MLEIEIEKKIENSLQEDDDAGIRRSNLQNQKAKKLSYRYHREGVRRLSVLPW